MRSFFGHRLFLPLVDARADCSDLVEAKHNFASRNKTRGNEKLRWHGTTRKCRIGDEGVTTPCSRSSCSLCCIIKSSFNISFFGKRTGWGRFGAGIYTSATSSKFVLYPSGALGQLSNDFGRSDSYSRNRCTSNWKAMLLNTVVVGKGYKMTADKTILTKPPTGYDSVSVAIL